ncbi:hypothetical protein ACSS6W_005913 [Trichoderma asperelloides]|uniref:Uncharacterized protein n=1 Tax=Trichoderma asperellum TaxID=101201 RepID=A0A6V8R266_TRIAP|nr:hypothetical protein LI328DRAFT_161221 [Trichoderma asperelloides]GFP58620.1 hypothetical protein TASIC1_0010043100 [Trichoderma asperellum]
MTVYSLGLLVASLAALVQAQQPNRPNDLNITQAQGNAYGCSSKACLENLQTFEALDRPIFGDAPFNYDFYATADNFTKSKPGDLLKLQRQNSTLYDITPGSSLWFIQYTSVGVGGQLVPSTGFILLPYLSEASNKTPLISYAHGTIGTAAACAASSSYNGYDYDSWKLLPPHGFAVVATDYAGLGNNYTTHKYGNPVINSEDVYFAVVAARKAFPNVFTTKWASLGHSQGAGAIWGLEENPRVASNQSGEYVGGVAVAPSARLNDLLTAVPLSEGYGFGPLIVNIFQSLNFSIQPPVLTPEAMKRYPLMNALGLCDNSYAGLNFDLPNHGILKPTPEQNKTIHEAYTKFQDQYGAATGRKGYKDFLVVQSHDDEIVNYTATIKAYDFACKKGNIVHLSVYHNLTHDESMAASAPEWLKWLSDRISGVPLANATKCTIQQKTPLYVPSRSGFGLA